MTKEKEEKFTPELIEKLLRQAAPGANELNKKLEKQFRMNEFTARLILR